MSGHALRDLDTAAIFQIVGDARRPEAGRRLNAGGRRTAELLAKYQGEVESALEAAKPATA